MEEATQENFEMVQAIIHNKKGNLVCARASLENFMAATRVIGNAINTAHKGLKKYFINNEELYGIIIDHFVRLKMKAREELFDQLRQNGNYYLEQSFYARCLFDNYCAAIEYLGALIMSPNLIKSESRTGRYVFMDYEFLCCKAYITSIRFDRTVKQFKFIFTNNVAI